MKLVIESNEIVLHIMKAVEWELQAFTKVEKKAYETIVDFNEGVET